ncbi:MAG: hypothetical protein U9N34_10760 [Candidatus Cloacimonadota bacterium]|nr:hypothetical protein [Candidatus Cloacimonadota bacterium]
MENNKNIELNVEYHQSGNYTLTERYEGGHKKDCEGALFANSNKGDFYKAVAKKIADLTSKGINVVYTDTAP